MLKSLALVSALLAAAPASANQMFSGSEFCFDLGLVASHAMTARQYDWTPREFEDAIGSLAQGSESTQILIDEVIRSAWLVPVFPDHYDKSETILEFHKWVELSCLASLYPGY